VVNLRFFFGLFAATEKTHGELIRAFFGEPYAFLPWLVLRVALIFGIEDKAGIS
jgi:hypothetical protein